MSSIKTDRHSNRCVLDIESLESRTLLTAAPHVVDVVADNRGEVVITMSRSLKDTTITRSAIQVHTEGPDHILGNADDVKAVAPVSWNSEGRKISIKTRGLSAGTGYRVKLVATKLFAPDGTRLDGEFSGKLPSGNGNAGGNFEFQTKNDKSVAPLVRMSTNHGILTIKMFRDAAPISVDNFFNYANSGRYDDIFFTRAIPGFIVQAGSLKVDSNNDVIAPTADGPIQNEFDVSNTIGTIAFAKVGPPPGQSPTDETINSATNQFFFNLGDNSSNLDNQNGGFTVFGKVVGSAGLDSINEIPTQHDIVVLHNPLNGQGVLPAFSSTGLTNVPIENKDDVTGSTQNLDNGDPAHNVPPTTGFVVTGNFEPRESLVMIRRTAVVMKVAALG
jgi:cyclophilin family peptidyl-prolyl cis-trans isomerase